MLYQSGLEIHLDVIRRLVNAKKATNTLPYTTLEYRYYLI